MKLKMLIGTVFLSAIIGIVASGCQKDPEVVAVPGDTTVIHDKPASPTVVVTPPPASSSHTETHTNTTTPDPTAPATTSNTTTTGN